MRKRREILDEADENFKLRYEHIVVELLLDIRDMLELLTKEK